MDADRQRDTVSPATLQSCLALFVSTSFLLACTVLPGTPVVRDEITTEPVVEIIATVPKTPRTSPSPPPGPSPPIPPGQIRASAIAGSWYPDDPDTLAEMIDSLLATARPVAGEPLGLIVPHAGYVYSGPVAAQAFKQLEDKAYDTAVIIAADHQSPLSNPISVWAEGGFETPLGVVPVDVTLAEALVSADPRITFDPQTHQGEHPIEIELPFLQRVCPQCAIVPVLMGSADEESVQALANALISGVGDSKRRVVVIASSDLSHYPRQADARRVDGATLAAMETGDPATVRQTITAAMAAGIPNLATCACGEAPILVTMRVAEGLGADTITILAYATSADSPYGDSDRVVGYGAVMFWDYESPDLSKQQQTELLELARTAIAEHLETGRIPDLETDDPALLRRSGAFVTLEQDDALRGCIGHLWADTALAQVVQHMAVSAATADPRFPPLKIEELAEIDLEISILSPMRRVTNLKSIEVGKHGLVIIHNGQQGVLLPQVSVEEGWSREEYLENLCYKAGLPGDCWEDEPALYAFTAIVFGE